MACRDQTEYYVGSVVRVNPAPLSLRRTIVLYCDDHRNFCTFCVLRDTKFVYLSCSENVNPRRYNFVAERAYIISAWILSSTEVM